MSQARISAASIRTPARVASGLAAFVLCTGLAAAATTFTRDGIEFCLVGAPGNRAPTDAEMPWAVGPRRPGAVSYSFALSKTEVTVGLWWEFVQAYEPFHQGPRWDNGLLGNWILSIP